MAAVLGGRAVAKPRRGVIRRRAAATRRCRRGAEVHRHSAARSPSAQSAPAPTAQPGRTAQTRVETAASRCTERRLSLGGAPRGGARARVSPRWRGMARRLSRGRSRGWPPPLSRPAAGGAAHTAAARRSRRPASCAGRAGRHRSQQSRKAAHSGVAPELELGLPNPPAFGLGFAAALLPTRLDLAARLMGGACRRAWDDDAGCTTRWGCATRSTHTGNAARSMRPDLRREWTDAFARFTEGASQSEQA
eukprot:scaffold9559_cov101-Isochrysis_galbana.AAC.1